MTMKIQQINQLENTYSINQGENVVSEKKHTENLQVLVDNKSAVEVSISEEGQAASREYLDQQGLSMKYTNVKDLPVANTNEVMFEHYMKIKEIEGQIFKDLEEKKGEYNVEDVMKATMEAYENLYNKIIKEHENGNRQVTYDLAGKRSLTLEEDLKGLDEAFERCLADLEGYITCQQTNKTFHYQYKKSVLGERLKEEEAYSQDNYNFFDEEYINSAVSMMQQAREEFLALFKIAQYEQGAATEIISQIMSRNAHFLTKTKKLFSTDS